MSSNSILVRFFEKKEYLEQFILGELRFMSCHYYKNLEGEIANQMYNNKYDATENAMIMLNSTDSNKPTNISFGNINISLMNCVGTATLSNPLVDKYIKILCMAEIKIRELEDGCIKTFLNQMKKSLGDYYCIITNCNEFGERLNEAIDNCYKANLIDKAEGNRVKYEDEKTYTGAWGPFKKPSGLSWQSEYRVAIRTKQIEDPFILSIKDGIGDIIVCGRTKDLYEGRVGSDGKLTIPNTYLVSVEEKINEEDMQ